jgi:ubiquinone/menaquinone biosynthesis C-methylase UbiE
MDNKHENDINNNNNNKLFRKIVIENLLTLKSDYVLYDDKIFNTQEFFNTKKSYYKKPESNRQIHTILKYGNSMEIGRVIQLLGKFYPKIINYISKIINNTDSSIYNLIKIKSYKYNSFNNKLNHSKRDKFHANTIYRYLKNNIININTYLDTGCNQGNITYELSKLFNIENVYGVDVIDSSEVNKNINYNKIQDNCLLPYPDNYFDLITANMTLHHIKNINNLVSEIYRVLKPNGYVFIREHDCWNAFDAMLIDIEHNIYNVVGSDEGSYNIYHYINYYGLDKIFNKFTVYKSDFYYMGIRNEISPTRMFYVIYKKK